VSQDEKTKKKAARSKAKPILEVSAIYEESAAQSVDASLPPLVAATQHSERAHASEQNGGLPCEVCGARSVDIHHVHRRGMGGSKRKDTIDNLIALCREHHDMMGDKKQYLDMFKEIIKNRKQ
jgi:hypothetical protein